MQTHTAAGGAASAVTAATLISSLAGSPWWLTVSILTALTVLGSVYLWTQTQLQLAQLAQLKTVPTEPPAVAALRAAARGSIPDDEPLRLTSPESPRNLIGGP